MKKDFDQLILDGNDIEALRFFANEYYNNGKMGMRRKRLIERTALKLETLYNKKFDYDEVPTRSKKTHDGVFAKQHKCSGRVVIRYEEEMIYCAICENCGKVGEFIAKSMDKAILKWNEME